MCIYIYAKGKPHTLATKVLLHIWQDYILLSNPKKKTLPKKNKKKKNKFFV